jgi:hypothetical protein
MLDTNIYTISNSQQKFSCGLRGKFVAHTMGTV